MTIKYYSQRLLNPFRGMLNTIEYNSAEAVTMNGVNWDIYVRNSALVKDLEQHNSQRIQTSEIRYGRWSKKKGLQRGPTIDSDDFNEMAATGEIVYQYLKQHSDDIPFPLRDNYELWLLDNNNKPLALLNSVVYKEDIELDQTTSWTTGIACQHYFKNKKIGTTPNIAHFLNQLINTNSNDSAQWILRNNDGSGTGLTGINQSPELINRNFSANDIPSSLINSKLFNNNEQQFIDEYISWLSPWLLVLQSFSKKQREILESQASQYALVIEKQFLLYPEIINQKVIKSALVEALMRNNQTKIVTENKVESVEFLELNNPTHHLNK